MRRRNARVSRRRLGLQLRGRGRQRQRRHGHDDPADQIAYDAEDETAEDRQHRPDQANQRGIDIEIFAQSAADARQATIRRRAHQALLVSRRGGDGRLRLARPAEITKVRVSRDIPLAIRTKHDVLLCGQTATPIVTPFVYTSGAREKFDGG